MAAPVSPEKELRRKNDGWAVPAPAPRPDGAAFVSRRGSQPCGVREAMILRRRAGTATPSGCSGQQLLRVTIRHSNRDRGDRRGRDSQLLYSTAFCNPIQPNRETKKEVEKRRGAGNERRRGVSEYTHPNQNRNRTRRQTKKPKPGRPPLLRAGSVAVSPLPVGSNECSSGAGECGRRRGGAVEERRGPRERALEPGIEVGGCGVWNFGDVRLLGYVQQ